MKNLRVVIPIALAALAITVASVSIVFAQESDKVDPTANKFAIRVADILGLDVVEVDDAIKRAREELRDEATQKKLNALVEKGRLTQEQADESLNRIQSRPEGIPAIGKHFFEKRGHHKGSESHGGFFGSRNHFNGKPSWEATQKKLNAAVENGKLTQEEAEAKLKVVKAKEAEKTASP
jgi:polyhydroxyalkanoate synthesis regulator phasin